MLEKEKIIDKMERKREEHKEFFKKKYGENWFMYYNKMFYTIEDLYKQLQWQYGWMLESGMSVVEVFDLEDFKKDILKKKVKEMEDVIEKIQDKIKELNSMKLLVE